MPESSTAMISARRLTRRFGNFVAVDGVTLEVSRGEIFGLLGPNGAGKTTLMRMLIGLLAPSAGSGVVAGLDIATETEAIKDHIGYMAQLFCLYNDLTIAENLEFFGGLHGLDGAALRARRDWALRMAGLIGSEGRIVGDLSLGLKQRVALASAVLHDPPVLVLDEPTSGIDPVSRRAFWALLRDVARQGKTIVISTHHVEEAESCDRIALMSGGRVIALDSPTALTRSIEDCTIELESEDIFRALGVAEGAPGVNHVVLFGRRLHLVVDNRARQLDTLPRVFAAAGVQVERLSIVRPTLEDAVMALLRKARATSSNDVERVA
jgi:ABC-2 type transport system ATP-binding protein